MFSDKKCFSIRRDFLAYAYIQMGSYHSCGLKQIFQNGLRI